MNQFDANLEPLFKLWDDWHETSDNVEDENWKSDLVSIEESIFRKIKTIRDNIDDYTYYFDELNIDIDRRSQIVIFHLALSIVDDGVFDKNIILLDFIKSLIHAPSGNYHEPLAMALNYCEPWIQEIVLDLMIKSKDPFCISSALGVIANSNLNKFKNHCHSILQTLSNGIHSDSDYDNQFKSFLSVLLKAIVSIRATDCIPTLEYLMGNAILLKDKIAWQSILHALVLLDSNAGWSRYLTECKTRGISSHYAYLLGQFGDKSSTSFILEQLKSNTGDDWVEEYLVSLGKLGDTACLESIIEFVGHDEIDIIQASLDAFYIITGADDEKLDFDEFDCSEEDCKASLLNWLNENISKLNPNIRYFVGKPFSFQTLIDALIDPNTGTRLTVIENLRVHTNIVIPYSFTGFVTSMINSQRNWQEWYNKSKINFPDGFWYRNGKQL